MLSQLAGNKWRRVAPGCPSSGGSTASRFEPPNRDTPGGPEASRFGTLSSDEVSRPSGGAPSIDSLGSFVRVSYFRIRDIAIDLVMSCRYI